MPIVLSLRKGLCDIVQVILDRTFRSILRLPFEEVVQLRELFITRLLHRPVVKKASKCRSKMRIGTVSYRIGDQQMK